jgi:hypothetical protein
MKHLYKQCKSIKQVNAYLTSIGLSDFTLDPDTFTSDFDGWKNSTESKGVSINVTTAFEVFIVKYSKDDITRLEEELMQ